LIVLRDGREVDRLVGAAPEQELRRWVEPHLPAVAEPERG
jgi:thioredoxin-like negative regulator of GroEL